MLLLPVLQTRLENLNTANLSWYEQTKLIVKY